MPIKKTSISLDPGLMIKAKRIARERGFKNSFSAYIAKVIEEDIKRDAELREKLEKLRAQIDSLPEIKP
jgi:hypothetical protein